MPTATDLVTDLPADFEVFGQAVATSMGDLLGGTTGQILSKATNTDMDFTWITNDVGDITAVTATTPLTGGGTSGAITVGIQDASTSQKGSVQLSDSTSTTSSILASTPTATKSAYDLAAAAIPKSTVTAKGSIVAATASSTPAQLAVGNNGETLVCDSSTSTGLRYQGNYAAGKNKIINGDFGIWQRGTSFSGTNQLVYTADRWQLNDFGGQVSNVVRSTFTPGTAPVAGYEGQFFATWSRAGAGTASSYFTQKIEDVRTFAGNTVTFSFWAKAAATESVDFYIDQNFGSGGSATVGSASTSFTLTTSWVRYTATLSLASISGKTVGTSSFLAPTFQVQTSQGAYTIDIWGVQLEAGSVATAFQTATGTLQGELAACYRYYYRVTNPNSTSDAMMPAGFAVATTQANMWMPAPVSMRVTPTSLDSANIRFFDGVSVFTPTISNAQASEKILAIAGVTSGLTQFRPYYAIASTAANASFLGWSAEL